ncbi:Tryptophan--tRNA ligase [Halomicronema hongdechloris C2206]|uniref:Tryptophan--tRNA ligase n=1 Tax=Halomicronema hongdechloris C2206 TaxID=1641165 RepID=A0A1Z3HPT2_9CYAN|nr:tryptophan--tRNA ligase [Halomicronema hongdechloris]ASC72177.1 Tryptophan--tRNA ligase [Halomicronema hongdechloris C2206]
MGKQRILSGIQPTGTLHLGNYLGAIRNWVDLQQEYEAFLFMADLHAITVPHDPAQLATSTYQVAAMYIACGIDPEQATIFVQSHLPAHAELAWLFNCVTPLNWLERMIQFREKAVKQGENVSIGLLDYPVLQAADILLYEPDLVPVGEDQKQHLELTRDIATRLNFQYGRAEEPILKLPDPLIREAGARVMSLTDGTKKMSKSDPSEQSRIDLTDPPAVISKKLKRAKTDPQRGLWFDDPERPECHNLLSLYMLLSNQTKAAVAAECREMGWGQFKPLLAETAVEALRPIQGRFHELMADRGYLEAILKRGNEKANAIAQQTLTRVKDALGYSRPL